MIRPTLGLALSFVALLLSGPSTTVAGEQEAGGITTLLESQKEVAADGDEGDEFGAAVSVDNDRVLIGATGEDNLGFDAGAAYIFTRLADGTDWGQSAKLTASDGATDDSFGAAVHLDGDIGVIGAPLNDAAGEDAGSAYVFERGPAGIWSEVAKLTASDAGLGARFGTSVSVSGDTVVVGSLDGALGVNSGAVYVFERDAGGPDGWGQVNKLVASDGMVEDRFGNGVDLFGDVLLVGAPAGELPPGEVFGIGAAYLFERDELDPNAWNEVEILTSADNDFGDLLGWSVSISGDYAIVGSPLDDELSEDAGSAYAFERNFGGADNWGQSRKILAFDGSANDGFGVSVSVDDTQAVIGAANDDDDGNQSGSAHIYVRDFNGDGLNLWTQVAKLKASDGGDLHKLGSAAAWGESQIVVGAPGNDAVYIYDLSRYFEPFETCIGFPAACDQIDLVTTFNEVEGVWRNWDCQGSDVPVAGSTRNQGDSARVICNEPDCPLGRVWGHIFEFGPETYDLWYIEGDDPPVQSQNDFPFLLSDGACAEAPPLDGGVPSWTMGIDR